jgi:hypothetical protein
MEWTGSRTLFSKAISEKLKSVIKIVDRDNFDNFVWGYDDFDNLDRDRDDFDSRSLSDSITRLRSLRFVDMSGRGNAGAGVNVSVVGTGEAWY